ncbi:MAG: Fic family protein [Erysipelotrichales bacterium]|nr:Fic family protein [Erysipelotrichales bacterium]
MNYDLFEKYIEEKEPHKYEKTYSWQTAIGLQDVDGLEPSNYLIEKAIDNIEGKVSFNEVEKLIKSYYQQLSKKDKNNRTEEADKVSVRIAEILSEKSFTFSPIEYISIHKRLFNEIYDHAGAIRDYNISKSEWVLDGDTVIYGNAYNLMEMLEYDFQQEKNFFYNNLSNYELIKHLAKFIADLWQIHIFGEGNTRTTAVFLIKYLRKMGFDVTNDIFAKNSWYFRNALVRANYNNANKNIYETTEYLEKFLGNLLFNEKNILSNRNLHISVAKAETILDTTSDISESEHKILNAIKKNPKIKQMEIANHIGKSLRTVKSLMRKLEEKNIIRRSGSKKSGYWEFVNK